MLASWAAKNNAMIDVLKLPFNVLEEQVHCHILFLVAFVLPPSIFCRVLTWEGAPLKMCVRASLDCYWKIMIPAGMTRQCCHNFDKDWAVCRCCVGGWRMRWRLAGLSRASCPSTFCFAAASPRPCTPMLALCKALCRVRFTFENTSFKRC